MEKCTCVPKGGEERHGHPSNFECAVHGPGAEKGKSRGLPDPIPLNATPQIEARSLFEKACGFDHFARPSKEARALMDVLEECKDGEAILDASRIWMKQGVMTLPPEVKR